MRTQCSLPAMLVVALGLGLLLPAGGLRAGVVDVPNLRLWLKADGALDKDASDRVYTWYDTTDATNNVTAHNHVQRQVEDENQLPVWQDGAINGHPVLHFDGTDDTLQIQANALGLDGAAGLSVFVVFRTTDDTGPVTSAYANSGTYQYTIGVSGGLGVFAANGGNSGPYSTTSAPVNDGQAHVLSGVYDGTNETLYLDGSLEAQTPKTGTILASWTYPHSVAFQGYTLGGGDVPHSGDDHALGLRWLAGDVAEVILYENGVSDPDRAVVEQYLMTRYDIPEPATLGLLGLGGLGLLVGRRRRS